MPLKKKWKSFVTVVGTLRILHAAFYDQGCRAHVSLDVDKLVHVLHDNCHLNNSRIQSEEFRKNYIIPIVSIKICGHRESVYVIIIRFMS